MGTEPHRPNTAIPPEERVPLREKFALGASQITFQHAVSNLHTPIFVNVLGLSPGWLGTLSLIERLWDAVTDGLMGWLTDRTDTRWGRRKPYILVGAILTALFLPVTYLVSPGWSDLGKAAWLLACMLTLALVFTIWNIPLQCLLLESTPNSVERTNVAVWRGYAGKVGWLGIAWTWWFVQLPFFADASGKTDMLKGAFWVLTVMGAIGLVVGLLPLIVQNRVGTARRKPGADLGLRQNMKLTFANRAFVFLLLFTLLFSLGFQLKLGLEFQTRLMYVFQGDTKQAAYIGAWGHSLSLVCSICGIPLFQYIARVRGKGFSLICVMWVVLGAGASTLLCYHPALPWLSILPSLLLAPANTGLWILIPSMTGDIVDYDEYVTGQRREGSYAATYSWFLKASQSLAGFGSGWTLVLSGFDQKLAQQPEPVLWIMRLGLVLIPTPFIALAIWVLHKYPLTPQRISEIHDELLRRRTQGRETSTLP